MFKAAFKGELDLKFFEQAEFESLDHISEENKPLIIARNALRFLMMGWSKSWTELITWPLFKAVFIERNPILVRAMRLAFQQGFEHLFKQLNEIELNDNKREQIQLYLSNCINLLPYSDLTPYESIKIPQLIDNKWVLVDYYITPIELSTQEQLIKDHDKVFAYGLHAINNEDAQSHLIFMGTTYPAGQGFNSQIDSDFKAFGHVGNNLYLNGRKNILKWLAEQKKKIHVCGVSLGGSLSLLFALDQGEHIDRVDALNPPGLDEHWGKPSYDNWEHLAVKPKVVIQQQANDPISIFGAWKKEWEIIRIIPPKDKKGPNAVCDHFLNYAGFSGTEFSYGSAEEQNKKRKYRNVFIFSLGRAVVYYTAIWPYMFLLRPLGFLVYEQLSKKSILFFLGIAVSLILLLSLLSVPPLYLALGIFASGLSYGFTSYWKKYKTTEEMNNKPLDGIAKLHDPQLPRNSKLNIYNPDNAIDLDLSYGELNTYYKIMRQVKQKELIPKEDKPFKHNKSFSKKTLLEECKNPELEDKIVSLHLSKAKAITIKRTLALVDKIGLDNPNELKQQVSEEYQRYCFGK